MAVTLGLAGLAGPAAAQDRMIKVSARGEVSVASEMATVVVAIQSNSENAADAMGEASAVTAAMLATLENENIPTADIQTGVIRLSPEYSQSVLSSGNQIVGYRAVNSIQVRVTNLDRLGSLLAGVVGDGANRLDRIDFGFINPTEAMDVARERAVAKTIRQAGVYADAAGVTVGDVMQLSVGNT
jgi:uncharacterized protein YggE